MADWGDGQRREMLRYANDSDRRFLHQISDDIEEFCELFQEDSIMMFPKLHTHYGYLIHTIAQTFGLVSMAIGRGDYRVSILCKKFLLMDDDFFDDFDDMDLQPQKLKRRQDNRRNSEEFESDDEDQAERRALPNLTKAQIIQIPRRREEQQLSKQQPEVNQAPVEKQEAIPDLTEDQMIQKPATQLRKENETQLEEITEAYDDTQEIYGERFLIVVSDSSNDSEEVEDEIPVHFRKKLVAKSRRRQRCKITLPTIMEQMPHRTFGIGEHFICAPLDQGKGVKKFTPLHKSEYYKKTPGFTTGSDKDKSSHKSNALPFGGTASTSGIGNWVVTPLVPSNEPCEFKLDEEKTTSTLLSTSLGILSTRDNDVAVNSPSESPKKVDEKPKPKRKNNRRPKRLTRRKKNKARTLALFEQQQKELQADQSKVIAEKDKTDFSDTSECTKPVNDLLPMEPDSIVAIDCESEGDKVIAENPQFFDQLDNLELLDIQVDNPDVGSEVKSSSTLSVEVMHPSLLEEQLQIEPELTKGIDEVVLPTHEQGFEYMDDIHTAGKPIELYSFCFPETDNICQPDQTENHSILIPQGATGSTDMIESSLFVFSAGDELNMGKTIKIDYETKYISSTQDFTEGGNGQALEDTNNVSHIQQETHDINTMEQFPTVSLDQRFGLVETMEPKTNEVISTSPNVIVETLENGDDEITSAYLRYSNTINSDIDIESLTSSTYSELNNTSLYRDASMCDTHKRDTSIQSESSLSASESANIAANVADNHLSTENTQTSDFALDIVSSEESQHDELDANSSSCSNHMDVDVVTDCRQENTLIEQAIAISDEEEEYQDSMQIDCESCIDVSSESSYEDAVETLSIDNESSIILNGSADNVLIELDQSLVDNLIITDETLSQISHRAIEAISDLPSNILETDEHSEGDNSSQINVYQKANDDATCSILLVVDSLELAPNAEEVYVTDSDSDSPEQTDSGMNTEKYPDTPNSSISLLSGYQSETASADNVNGWLKSNDSGKYLAGTNGSNNRAIEVSLSNYAETISQNILNAVFQVILHNTIENVQVEHLDDHKNVEEGSIIQPQQIDELSNGSITIEQQTAFAIPEPGTEVNNDLNLEFDPVQNIAQPFIVGDTIIQVVPVIEMQPYANVNQVHAGIVPVLEPVLTTIANPLPQKQDSMQVMDEVVGMVQTIIDRSDELEYADHDWINWKNDPVYVQLSKCLGEIRMKSVPDDFIISISAIIRNGGLVQQATCMFYLTIRAQIEQFKKSDSDIGVLTFPRFNKMHCYIIYRIAEMFTLASYIFGEGAFRMVLLCKRHFWHSPVGPVASQKVQSEIELHMQTYGNFPLNERVKTILGNVSMLEVTAIFKKFVELNRLYSFDDETTSELNHFLTEQVKDFLIDPRRPRVLLLPNVDDYQRYECFQVAGQFQLAVTTIGQNDIIVYDPLNCRPAFMTMIIERRNRIYHEESNFLRVDAEEFVPKEEKSISRSSSPDVPERRYRRPSSLFLARYRTKYFGPPRDSDCDYYYVELINEVIWQLCRYENIMDQVFDMVGDDLQIVTVEQHNYYEFDDGASFMTHIVEMYDFPTRFVTRDLVRIINHYRIGHFRIKWVHDNSALIIFDSIARAYELLGCRHRDAKFRPFDHACPEAKRKAATVPEIYSTSFVKENTSTQWKKY